MIQILTMGLLLIAVQSLLRAPFSLAPTITIQNQQILSDTEQVSVMSSKGLNKVYNDTIYNQVLNCENGYLTIINNSVGSNISFAYTDLPGIDQANSYVTAHPNEEPRPSLELLPATDEFMLYFNCPEEINSHNFYNKIDISLLNGTHKISFLLDCDPNTRHKLFEMGYLILAAINAVLLLGVAFHSEVWSIKLGTKRLRVTIRWFYVLIAFLVGIAVALVLYFAAFKDFQSAFVGTHYFGIAISTLFVFICFNQVFYLIRNLRTSIHRKFRVCQALSFVATVGTLSAAFFVDNWILYNSMGICICVASIKIFHFESLKQAFICMTIITGIFTLLTSVIHFLNPERSYNDYATQLSSPLFLVVPDLVNNLFKKCSWLMVVDIIFPGVTLSYLRLYDINRGSKVIGVYTLWGNITVIVSTTVWVTLEYWYPSSIPFSLVTYPSLMLVIFLISWTRNEWEDLLYGMFQKETSLMDESKLTEREQSFGVLVTKDIIDPLRASLEKESGSRESSSGHRQ